MALYDNIYGYSGLLQTPTALPFQAPQPQVQPAAQQVPFVKIVTVAGESAAKSVKLAPGSTLLAADESESIIWFIKANDVGPNTVKAIPFDSTIFSGGSSAVDLSAVEKRLTSIEERMNRYESNDGSDKRQSNNPNNTDKRR